MAFDYTNAIPMTRAMSTLISGATDDTIRNQIEKNALPTVRMLFLTATDGTGNHVLYDSLADLANPGVSAPIETLVDQVMEEPTIKDAVRAAVAKMAAAYTILDAFGVMESQQKVAAAFEKQARADVDRLVKSPLLKSAAASVVKRANALAAETVMTLYMALDADPATKDLDVLTVDSYAGAQLPYVGAPEAGRFGLIVNGTAVEVTVAAGDTPIAIFNKLLTQVELLGSSWAPVALAINERLEMPGLFELPYTDPLSGTATSGSFSLSAEGGSLTLLPRSYEGAQDMVAATFYMQHRLEASPTEFAPGIKGLRYGISPRVNLLTLNGPHAVVADLSQGRSVTVTSSNDEEEGQISECFFFQVTDTGGVTAAAGSLTYQVNAHTLRTVAVPAGTDALGLARLMAEDLAAVAATHRVIGAVRPSTRITVNGTPATAPALSLVAFGIESELSRIVVALKSVPAGSAFAVVAPTTLTASLFDGGEKSVVVTTVINRVRISSSGAAVEEGATTPGDALVVTYRPSTELAAILNNFGKKR